MIHFCNELKIKLAEYTQKVGYTFDPIDVVKVTKILKRELKKYQIKFIKLFFGSILFFDFDLLVQFFKDKFNNLSKSLYF